LRHRVSASYIKPTAYSLTFLPLTYVFPKNPQLLHIIQDVFETSTVGPGQGYGHPRSRSARYNDSLCPILAVWAHQGRRKRNHRYAILTRKSRQLLTCRTVRLQSGALAVFSPVALTDDVKRKVSELGEVKYIAALDVEVRDTICRDLYDRYLTNIDSTTSSSDRGTKNIPTRK
jgi:hypothetical protein